MCGVHRDRLCTVLGCESGASEANRLSKRGVWDQGRAESVNLPPELYSGRRGQDLCVYLRQCRRCYRMRHLYGCRESLCCWMIGAEDVSQSFWSSEKPVTTHQGGMCAAMLFQRLVAMPSCSQSE